MIIREYLARTGTTQEQFAKSLGVTRAYLGQVLLGIRRFHPNKAIKVHEITGGKVTRDEALFPEFYKDWMIK